MHCGNSQADRLAAEATVVGAGPAGLTAAMSLAATGVDVLVYANAARKLAASFREQPGDAAAVAADKPSAAY